MAAGIAPALGGPLAGGVARLTTPQGALAAAAAAVLGAGAIAFAQARARSGALVR